MVMSATNENDDTATLSQMSPEKMLEKLLHYKKLYEQEIEDFDEYKLSSQEMEQMQEQEIEQLRKEVRELQTTNQRLQMLQDSAQERYENERKEQLKIEETLRKQLDAATMERDSLRVRIRALEQKNDDLERGDRYNSQNLEDLEKRLNEALERTALLECELADKQTSAEEVYRLREELRDSRPRMAVEPLRVVGRAEPVVAQAEVFASPPSSSIDADNNKTTSDADCKSVAKSPNQAAPGSPHHTEHSGGLNSTVNKIVRNLMSKVDRLEALLTSMKPPHSSPSASGVQTTV